ncbi:putative repeat protein (TIGR03803 family) [Granulicella aggregans]|uniref:Putative repeat protein (TIGR03803 family) n=1 Tax=Granulicella aggregans TaxID=474949 RepID=A0A7W7ZET7_9BACT|nr:choice-of-anchor tandem repeat GloVer-containing protein [Granulicella aggregans]MBB5058046.1 putative repeat protein (TIGR03803 family) [Granulicella aggregans]
MKQVPVLMIALLAAALPLRAQSHAPSQDSVKAKLAQGARALVPGANRQQSTSGAASAVRTQAAAASSQPTLQISSGVGPLVLHTFDVPTSATDGQGPDAPVIFASDGRLYSTTTAGGKNGCGTIFSYDPATQAYLTLYSLDCNKDGELPLSGLIQATDGYLYGTTIASGPVASPVFGGSIFRYNIATGAFTTLYRFQHGGTPYGDLIDDGNGTLYGTTFADGAHGDGSIWSWSYATNKFNTLYSFTGEVDGAGATGGLVLASDGRLYGTAAYGGTLGWGTAFVINTDGTGFKSFYSFTDFYLGLDGSAPSADLVEAQDGNLYGTSCCGGALGVQGAFFRITPNGADSTLTPLAALGQSLYPTPFVEGGDVDLGRPMIAGDGYMYITPSYGGSNPGGTTLQMDTFGDANRIYSFENPYDDFAVSPLGGVMEGQDGNLYGATYTSPFASGILYALNTGLPPAISLTTSTTSAYVGVPLSIDWSVNNAFSNNAAVCMARSTDGTFGGNGSAGLRSIAGEQNVTPVGSGDVTYSFTCGGVESATAKVHVSRVPTTTAVVTASSVEQGQTAKISAKVTAHVGTNAPNGSVSLVVNGQTLSKAALSNGTATFFIPTSGVAPGLYKGYVSYAGTNTFYGSTSTNDLVDLRVLPKASFVASPATTIQGLDSTFTVHLTNTGAPAPTGTVTFKSPTINFGSTTVTKGVASLLANFATAPAGTYQITATYSGDNYNEPVSATQTIQLNRAETIATLTGPAAINAGSSGEYKVVVIRPNLPGTATGKITLALGTAVVGSGTLSGGTATITVFSSAAKAGTYHLTAQYSGDQNDTSSLSLPLVVTIR